jgi:phage gpG-like protein
MYKVSNASGLNKRISELMERVWGSAQEIAREAAEEIGELSVEYAKQNIETTQNMDGHSEHTPKLTENLSGGERSTGNLLDETGEMKNSIRLEDAIFTPYGIIVELSVDVPYAEYHEMGADNITIPNQSGTFSIPARPFLTPAMVKAIRKSFSNRNLESRIRKSLADYVKKRKWRKHFK